MCSSLWYPHPLPSQRTQNCNAALMVISGALAGLWNKVEGEKGQSLKWEQKVGERQVTAKRRAEPRRGTWVGVTKGQGRTLTEGPGGRPTTLPETSNLHPSPVYVC